MFRSMTQYERELLDYLLEPNFPGRDALRQQIATAHVEELDDCPCLRFHVNAPVIAEVKHRIPIEAESKTGDIQVLLHVLEGRVDELEIVRANPAKPLKMPSVNELKRFCPDNWAIE